MVLAGAGATLAESAPARPPRTQTPPLDSTFFQLCELAQLEGRATVRQYMTRRYGLDPFADGLRMEEVFNYLYADAISPGSSDETVQAYWLLLRMYAAALTRTTRELKGTSQAGVGALLRHLWNAGTRELDIVTFNQDLVIENALEEMRSTGKYDDLPWDFQNAYATDFEEYWQNPSFASFKPQSLSGESIQVLKLHGSLNWMYRARSAEDARNALRSPSGTPGCLLQRVLPIELRAVDSATRRKVHLLPLVVPPIYEKSTHITTQLESVWAAAESTLEQARRLIVFGYSFPDGDFAALAMLRRCFVANDSLNSVTIINPDPTVAGKVAALTGAEEVHLYRSLQALRSGESAEGS